MKRQKWLFLLMLVINVFALWIYPRWIEPQIGWAVFYFADWFELFAGVLLLFRLFNPDQVSALFTVALVVGISFWKGYLCFRDKEQPYRWYSIENVLVISLFFFAMRILAYIDVKTAVEIDMVWGMFLVDIGLFVIKFSSRKKHTGQWCGKKLAQTEEEI